MWQVFPVVPMMIWLFALIGSHVLVHDYQWVLQTLFLHKVKVSVSKISRPGFFFSNSVKLCQPFWLFGVNPFATTTSKNDPFFLAESWVTDTKLVYDWNHYFGLGPIPKPKPKLADTFNRYCNRYRNWTLILVPDTETEFQSHTFYHKQRHT